MKPIFYIPITILCIPIAALLLIEQTYKSVPKDTLIEGFVGQPSFLHPLKSQENKVDQDLIRLIYRSLVKYDKEGNLIADLAEDWETSADELEYTLHLKKDVFWHDGERFTSDDVVFTARRSPPLKEIEIIKIDDATVRFRLENKFAPFLDLLTLAIAPEHVDINKNTLQAVGTGDFKVTEIKFRGELVDSLTLDRLRPGKMGKINRLVFFFFENDNDLEIALRLKQVDASSHPYSWPGFKIYKTPLLGRYYGVFLNVRKEGLSTSLDFRKALAHSTPKEMIVKEVFEGKARVIDGPIQNSWAEEKDIERYSYKEYSEERFEGEITLVVPKTAEHIETGKMLRDSWSRLGITVNLKEVELREITEKIIKPHDFDVLLLGQEVGRDPDRYSLWHSTQVDFPGLNFTGYKQVRVDKALEKGRQTLDREERRKHYLLFQKLLSQDIPAIYLYQPYFFYTVSEKIKGLDLDYLYVPADRFNSIDNWRIEK